MHLLPISILIPDDCLNEKSYFLGISSLPFPDEWGRIAGMIRKLAVEGVTVFPRQETFTFVPGVNIIVGGNDSGKSHLMKLCYAISKWGSGGSRRW